MYNRIYMSKYGLG